jgi:hypothetical protein
MAWLVDGDSSGEHYINTTYVESVIELEVSTMGVYGVRIIMASGAEYYGYFPSKEERTAFITGWAGEVADLT